MTNWEPDNLGYIDSEHGVVGPVHVADTDPAPKRRRRGRGRRRTDLPPWAVVLIAVVTASETVALAWLAAGH